MSVTHHVEAIDATVQKTYSWLHDIGAAAGDAGDRRSYEMLRGVLHTLRDRLPVELTAHLGAQLPMLVRGIYYEGWRPAHKPEKLHAHEFLEHVAREAMLDDPADAERVVRAVVATLRREIAAPQVDEVVEALPTDIRRLLVAA
jgi:uncharacterized protein (DUF2267 family)